MMIFTFLGLDWKYFFGKFGPKIQNCLLKLKFGTKTSYFEFFEFGGDVIFL